MFALEQSQEDAPLKTTACEIAKHPEAFDGKMVQVRAMVDSGVQDLPSGISDDSCGAEFKFYMPDDSHFSPLVKSKGFQKLLKQVKRNPVVEATVTGIFKRADAEKKFDAGISLDSVSDVVAKPQYRVRH